MTKRRKKKKTRRRTSEGEAGSWGISGRVLQSWKVGVASISHKNHLISDIFAFSHFE